MHVRRSANPDDINIFHGHNFMPIVADIWDIEFLGELPGSHRVPIAHRNYLDAVDLIQAGHVPLPHDTASPNDSDFELLVSHGNYLNRAATGVPTLSASQLSGDYRIIKTALSKKLDPNSYNLRIAIEFPYRMRESPENKSHETFRACGNRFDGRLV
jgi:hypothetical protein